MSWDPSKAGRRLVQEQAEEASREPVRVCMEGPLTRAPAGIQSHSFLAQCDSEINRHSVNIQPISMLCSINRNPGVLQALDRRE